MKKEKKQALVKKIKKYMYILFFMGVSVYIFTLTSWGQSFISFYHTSTDFLAQKANLKLEQVVVDGHNRTQKEQVNKALNLVQGMPIFDIVLPDKITAVAQLPWVKSVSIERRLPNQLLIHIVEKTPIALWQNQGKYLPLDETGALIEDNQTQLADLILVVGTDAPEHTIKLLNQLNKYPDIKNLVKSAVRVGNRRWNLYLNDAENGVRIELPESEVDEALSRLKKFNDEGQILQRDLKIIDLKVPNRLIVRLTDEGDKK